MEIVPFEESMRPSLIALSLRAWEPVFESVESELGSDIFRAQHPDWRVTQTEAIEKVCADTEIPVWVAIEEERVVAFSALKFWKEEWMGEVYMIAVDPDFQRQGIGRALTEHSLNELKKAGMTTAMVETGGDPGHGPARQTYESAGFRLFPVARYFKKL